LRGRDLWGVFKKQGDAAGSPLRSHGEQRPPRNLVVSIGWEFVEQLEEAFEKIEPGPCFGAQLLMF
jgi:hypothetical protein